MRHLLKIMVTVFVIIAAVGTGALTARSLRLRATQIESPAIAYAADGEITANSQVLQRFTLYSDGKGSQVEIRASFDKETGQQSEFEKAWYTVDKGGFRQKNNRAELNYIGVSPTSFRSSQFFRAQGKEERRMFGLPVFLTRNDNPDNGPTVETWWSPDLGTVVKHIERAKDSVLEIKLTSVQLGEPDPGVFVLPSLALRYDEHDRLIRFFESRGNKAAADKQRAAQQATRQKYGDFLKLE